VISKAAMARIQGYQLKLIAGFSVMLGVSGCLADSTIKMRVSEALPTANIGVLLFSHKEVGCAYAEFEYLDDRSMPKGLTDPPNRLGRHWTKVTSVDDLDASAMQLLGYNLDIFAGVLLTARNCARDNTKFYEVISETPGFVTIDQNGEQVILIPLDQSLPLYYFSGQI
jgi:hypothetical protein